MFLSQETLRYLHDLSMQPTEPEDIGTQIAGGLVQGATLGAYDPFPHAGPPGWPRTISSLVGGALPAVAFTEGAALPVAALGRFAPSLVTAGAVGRPLQTLSSLGRKVAMGLAGGALTALPEALSSEPRTLLERLGSAGAGIGLGVAGESLLGRLGRSTGPPTAQEAEAAAAKAGGLFPQSPLRADIQARMARVQQRIDMNTELLEGIPLAGPNAAATQAYGKSRKQFERLIKQDEGIIEGLRTRLGAVAEQGVSTPPMPPSAPGVTPPPMVISDAVKAMTPLQMRAILQQRGISAIGVSDDRMRELVTQVLSQRALPLQSQAQQLLGGEPTSLGPIVRDQPYIPGVNLGKDVAELMGRKPGMVRGPQPIELVPPGKTPVELGQAGPVRARPSDIEAFQQQFTQKIIAQSGRRPTGVDPEHLIGGESALTQGKLNISPLTDSVARIATDSMFPNVRTPEFISSDPATRARDLRYLLAPGYSKSDLVKFLGRKGVIPATWFLAGTAIEELPYKLNQAMRMERQLTDEVLGKAQSFLAWSPETKESAQRLFYQNMGKSRDTLEAALRQGAPEALGALPDLREWHDRIWLQYLEDGAVKPTQYWTNYLPVVRDSYQAKATGTVMIEKGSEYFSRNIENVLASYEPRFVRARTITGPEDFPRKVSFDDTIRLYARQFARHQTIKEMLPELNALLAKAPEEYKQYAADLVNYWLGTPKSSQPMSEMWSAVRSYNFIRDIGWSILSPLVNTLQRLNTFAAVHSSSFFKAFADAYDPERMKLAAQALGRDVLQKGGIENAPINPTTLSGWMAKLAEKSGRLFGISESGNRSHAFLAGLREAERRGIPELADRIAFATRVVDDTQFIMSSGSIPIFRSTNIGRLAGQFQTFRLNQMHFMARLVDEAQQGMKGALAGNAGEISRVLPLLKFLGTTVAVGGGSSMLMGDWGEEKATRAVLGKAMRIPGVPEYLFGVTLASQMGLGSVGADDINSFLFYLPGPTATFAQGLVGMALGIDLGHGYDMSQAGRQLSFDERVRLLAQQLPAGIQVNRSIQALRLIQNHGEYREATDWGEALGIAPATGHLSSQYTASTAQALMAAGGLPLGARMHELRTERRIANLTQDYGAYSARAAKYLAAGHQDAAFAEMKRFYHKWRDQLTFEPPISDEAFASAMTARTLPPLQRKPPPAWAVGAEPYQITPPLFGK